MADARNRVHITYAQLVQLMLGVTHATPIGIVTRTEPKMRKTNNPYHGRILKVTEANVFANCNYEDRVNRQLAREHKESDFVAGDRAVDMQRVYVNGKPTPVLRMTKKDGSLGEYLEVHFYDHLSVKTRYLLDRREDIAKSEFESFLYTRDSESAAERQGTNCEQIVRTYSMRNVVEVRMSGVDYAVMP